MCGVNYNKIMGYGVSVEVWFSYEDGKVIIPAKLPERYDKPIKKMLMELSEKIEYDYRWNQCISIYDEDNEMVNTYINGVKVK